MIQNIATHPGFFLFLLVILCLLMACAVLRVRRERRLKYRAIQERRKSRRADAKRLRQQPN